jgi:hypothetical protein
MTDYDRTNTGIVGKNTKKEKDSHPDITGSINVEGKEFWLNGWQKKRNDGTGTFYSLSVKPKEAKSEQRQEPKAQQAKAGDQFDDDIPF